MGRSKPTSRFRPGDRVRVIGYASFTSFPDPELFAIGDEVVVNAVGRIGKWNTEPGRSCHLLELVQNEPAILADPAKDIGLEFLKAQIAKIGDGVDVYSPADEAILHDLAAAYGKRIQWIHRMELVDDDAAGDGDAS